MQHGRRKTSDTRVEQSISEKRINIQVRNAARINLANLLTRYPETTLVDEFIDEITVAINDQSKPEIVKVDN